MTYDGETDLTKLRYVLYARRSTTDEGSQVRSLGDQVKECKKLAERKGLRIIDVLKESGSAKRPDQRPVFNQMLKDIDAEKYDAILSWAPDRLSRNMLEGGLLINLLDDEKLKDLQFSTHHFTNDPTGKLTLGIMFSISKHFSDDLSRKVKRGVSGNFDDGKSSGSPKWGYERSNDDGLYRPNDHFDLIQQAWHRRAGGDTNKAILEFLLERNYYRLTKITKKNKKIKKILPTEKSIGKMFRDPFYYGVLIQTEQTIDLREVYNFEPMIDEDLFNQVQSLAYIHKRDINPKKRVEFKPLMHMVYCGVCNNSKWMIAGKNKPGGSQHHVLTYRCDNPDCKRDTRSVRAHYIFDAIYSHLERLELTEDSYTRYSSHIDNFTDDKIVAIKQNISSKRGALAHKKKELDSLSLNLGNIDRNSPAYAINEARIQQLAFERNDLEDEIEKLEEKIANPSKIKLTKEQFLNLVKLAPDKMRAGSSVEKDRIARILFLNLRVDNKKALSVIWREPFASLVEALEIHSGARERT